MNKKNTKIKNRLMMLLWKIWSVFYFIILFYVVFFASRRPSPSFHNDRKLPMLTPFKTKWFLYQHMHDVSQLYLDIVGNIIMFVPYALFLHIVFHVRNYWFIIGTGFLLSLLIETTQYFTGIGQADVDDLIFNTLGALLGVLIIDGIRISTKFKE